jgi:hypothetical protein
MRARALSLPTRPFAPLFTLFVAFASLACSGSSEGDGDEGDDDSGGTSSGGTSSGGSAGSGTGGSAGTPAYCDAAFMPTDPTLIIDDMEDGDALARPVGNRTGGWWIAGDGTAGGMVEPPSDAAPLPETIPGNRCDSELGIRMTGQGFTEWGVSLSLSFRFSTELETIDVSSYSGVMFWARTGETHNSPIRVQFQDSNTRPEGGVCDPTPGSGSECYNGWGTDLYPIGTEWRLYKLDFSRMTQRDFGLILDAFDTTAVYNIEWNVTQNSVFDVWIDDVWLYE